MAITAESMLLRLNPRTGGDPIAAAIDNARQVSAQREQMRLARERFEEEKRRAEEQKQLTLLQERNEMARAQMQQERLRAEAEAKAAAEVQAALLAQQQTALGKAGELAGTGKAQQLAAMSPLFDQLGYDQNYVGSVNGLPAYDVVNREQEQARADQEFEQAPRGIESWDGSESAVQSLNRLQGLGLGYPTNERGTLEDPGGADRARLGGTVDEAVSLEPGVAGVDEATGDALSPGEADMATAEEFAGEGDVADVSVGGRGMIPALLEPGDPFARALAASRAAEASGGRPVRGPDEEDYLGAVPRNRIDMAAMNAETLARLNPALQARVAGLPPELQEAAKQNAAAIGGLGLEAADATKEFDEALRAPVSIYNSQQNLLAEKEKAQVQREDRSAVQQEQWHSMGIERARNSFKDSNLETAIGITQAAGTVRDLMKGGKRNHAKAINYLMNLTGNKGSQTEADALRMLGGGQLSTIEQVQDWLHSKIAGGFSPEEIESINAFVDMQLERNQGYVYDWLSQNDRSLRNHRTNRYVREGYEEFRNSGAIPPDLLDQYDALAKKADAANGRSATSAPRGEADAILQDKAAETGLNGQVLGQLMGGESGGDPKAANENRTDGLPKSSAKGAFQMLDSTARDMGFKDAADYSSRPLDEQIDAGLKLFKNKGLTKDSPAEDYALTLAAPSKVGKWKSRDEVVYPKDSDGWKGNPGWRSAGDGDCTVGSITDYYLKAGKQRAAESDKADAAPAKGAERKADPSNPYPDNPKAKRALDLLEKL